MTLDTLLGHYQSDVWSSTDGKVWERHIEHAPWRRRVYHDVVVLDERLLVMEGYGSRGKNMKDAWYASDGQNWHEVLETSNCTLPILRAPALCL